MEMWICGFGEKWEKISWADKISNEEILQRINTSSSAIAERPRDAWSTSNRKPVKIAFIS